MTNPPNPESDRPVKGENDSGSSESSGRSRREFLSGKIGNAGDSADLAGADERLPMDSPPKVLSEPRSLARQVAYVEEYSHRAMACEFSLMFNMHQYPNAAEASMHAFELVDTVENQMSVYRPDSELSEINRKAASQPVEVEERLFELLTESQQLHLETNGAFDFTGGPLSKAWGFDQREPAVPDPEALKAARAKVGAQHVKLGPDNQIAFSIDDLTVNLNAIGKGHAIDRVASLLRTEGVDDFVIHGGQSSVAARGARAVEDRDASQGWSVGLSHPALPDTRLAEIFLQDEALGTSGTARQGFYHGGKRFGHILDPRTGWPPTHFLSTTVISPRATLCDALATAFFVMSIEEIEAYCAANKDVKAILVLDRATATSLPFRNAPGGARLVTFNLEDKDWKPLK